MFYKNLLLQQTATDLTQTSLIYTMPWRKSLSSFYYTKLAKEAAVYSSVDWTQSRYETPRYRKFSGRGVEIFLESSPWNRLNPTSVQDERELFDTNFFLPPLPNYFSPRFLINTIITSIAPDGRWNFFFLDRSNWIFLPILFFFLPTVFRRVRALTISLTLFDAFAISMAMLIEGESKRDCDKPAWWNITEPIYPLNFTRYPFEESRSLFECWISNAAQFI